MFGKNKSLSALHPDLDISSIFFGCNPVLERLSMSLSSAKPDISRLIVSSRMRNFDVSGGDRPFKAARRASVSPLPQELLSLNIVALQCSPERYSNGSVARHRLNSSCWNRRCRKSLARDAKVAMDDGLIRICVEKINCRGNG